ncbi:Multidrug resistance protein 1A [Sarcoptes scabiei]|uniref:Multidrug resistance protein 1A n=3 Tax=Sarcoptes scabiei TaxID=52283 RepID=A0A834REF2_SARSC|nr:Multidrug resistance protein 1A [Sarcoptes scabiei]
MAIKKTKKIVLNPKEIGSKTNSSASLRQILKYTNTLDIIFLILGIIGSFIASISWPVLTITFGDIVDVFVGFEFTRKNSSIDQEELLKQFNNDVYFQSAITGIVTITFAFGHFLSLYSCQILSLRLTKTVKRLYFRSILRQEIAWFDEQNSGEFASKIASDFKKFENAFNENLSLMMYNGASVLTHLALGFYYGWELNLVILSVTPIMMLSSIVLTKLQVYFTQKELKSYSLASSVAEEVISSIQTVFAFGGQQKEYDRYESKLRPGMIFACKRNFVTSLCVAIHWATIYLALALGIWYGVHLIVDEHTYSIGKVVIVFWSVTGAAFSVGYMAPFYETFQIGKTAAKSLFEIIERQSNIDSSKHHGKQLQEYRTDIEFSNIHFSYPTRPDVPILQGLNLKIKHGQIVALVGPSGCGKSTTMQLLQRFYDPIKGGVFLGDCDLKDLNVGWLRRQFGIVRQEPVLFDDSIEENIRIGMPLEQMEKVTKAQIEKAAREANAHEFISKLPSGYQTYVGDRGAQLSGGQKQRIAIARALISNPKILLLDEATSALDLESEAIVQAALDRASHNRTTIIIAHRLSTIINADRIIYIENGQVIEDGDHKTLMATKGKYYQLVQAQNIQTKIKDEFDDIRHEDNFHQQIERQMERRSTLEMRLSFAGSGDLSLKLHPNTQIDNDDYDDGNEPDGEMKKRMLEKKFPFKKFFRLIMMDKWYFLIATLAALLYGMATPVYALIFGEFVNIFAISDDGDFLKRETLIYSMAFVGLSVSLLICCTIQITLFGIASEKLTKRLRTMMYKAILCQPISFFDEKINSSGALCARLANDAANVQGATGLKISMLCQAISVVVFSLIMGFLCNWRLLLVSMILMPFVAIASMISSSMTSKNAHKDSETAEKFSKITIEVVNAIRTVVSLTKERYFYAKLDQILISHYRAVRVKCFLKAIVMSISLGMPLFAYTVCYLYGGYLIAYGLLRSSDFFKIIDFRCSCCGQSAVLSSDFSKAKIAAMNIFNLVDKTPSISRPFSSPKNDISKKPKRSSGNISFRGVCFGYPSRSEAPILNGLSFDARQGETIALVGGSGCGKSTTIKLIERFYDCTKGQILLDGSNILNLDVDWLRRQMSLVSQEPKLFGYSIKENIAYGDLSREISFDEIVKAAQMANVHDFIQQLPLGYDTTVGGKGQQLSGGQKQRIAIARALIRNPSILLLDEATSALDTASEQLIQDALDEVSKNRTCLIIAHRLKTIINADKIVVIDGGQNVEEGNHQELLARRGQYWKLYNHKN